VSLLISLIIALLVALAAVWFLPVLQGYVLIRTGGWAIEMNVLVLLLALLSAYLLLRLAVWLWNLPGNAARRYLERRSMAQLEIGMLALSEGNWGRAEKALRLSAKGSASPAMQYIAAAKAAQAGGNEQRIEEYLEKANHSTQAQHPVAVTRAQLLLAAGDPISALDLLEEIRRPRETRSKVLELLARAYERLERWQDLAALVPGMVKHKLIDADHGQRLEHRAARQRLATAADIGDLQGIWDGMSKTQKQESELLAEYALNAIKLGRGEVVEKDLKTALKREWSDQLVTIFGQLGGNEERSRLKQAQAWFKLHPDNAMVHLTLARVCMAAQLWGKAREHFETSLVLQPTPEAYQELGDLLASNDDNDGALGAYRKALAILRGAEGLSLTNEETGGPAQD
jgi:HemY protein